MKMLLKEGIDVRKGQLLHHAIMRKSPDQFQVFEWLLRLDVSINELRGQHDPESWAVWQSYQRAETPLHDASRLGKASVVAFLLERGAEASIRNTIGETALEIATFNDHRDVIVLLRAHGKVEVCTEGVR